MKFTLEKNGRVMMWTEDEKCIPDKQTLLHMKAAGYKVKRDNRPKMSTKPQPVLYEKGGPQCG